MRVEILIGTQKPEKLAFDYLRLRQAASARATKANAAANVAGSGTFTKSCRLLPLHSKLALSPKIAAIESKVEDEKSTFVSEVSKPLSEPAEIRL